MIFIGLIISSLCYPWTDALVETAIKSICRYHPSISMKENQFSHFPPKIICYFMGGRIFRSIVGWQPCLAGSSFHLAHLLSFSPLSFSHMSPDTCGWWSLSTLTKLSNVVNELLALGNSLWGMGGMHIPIQNILSIKPTKNITNAGLVTSRWSACCNHVVNIIPVCCQHFASILPACLEHVAGVFSTNKTNLKLLTLGRVMD